ncbi:hypothetical protein ACTFXZ_15640, partial [Enterococcus faecium]
DQSINQSKITKNLSQNEVHSDPDLILYNPSVLIDKEPLFDVQVLFYGALTKRHWITSTL